MSLYNMLFGVNELAPILLKCLNLTPYEVPRFRDCFISDNSICIHTRTGGGNREDYQAENEELAAHPEYLRDEDDDFDCTYANFFFKFPKDYEEDLKALADNIENHMPSDKWKALFQSMEKQK